MNYKQSLTFSLIIAGTYLSIPAQPAQASFVLVDHCGNPGIPVEAKLSFGTKPQINFSDPFIQICGQDGTVIFKFPQDVPVLNGQGSVPLKTATNWEQSLIFPNGKRLPFGNGTISVNGNITIIQSFAFIDSTTGDLLTFDDTLSGSVAVPDFASDLNGDGVLDNSDTIYVATDGTQWSPTSTFLPLGTLFSTIGGRSSSLPGYFFSTTPTSFDPISGKITGNPIPDDTLVFPVATHEIIPVDESDLSLSVLAFGILGAGATLKRKLKPSKSIENETTKVS